jgi:hypothetical protein
MAFAFMPQSPNGQSFATFFELSRVDMIFADIKPDGEIGFKIQHNIVYR